jgi:hypothetical protein
VLRGSRQRPEGGGLEEAAGFTLRPAMDLESNYEIARTAEFIHSRNFARVALQVTETTHTKKKKKKKKPFL